ncbi:MULTISPECIES: FMN-binding negative transcriptional regulator [unclassified Sphingobacterium]|uniref:FMN-binding negative transcriptional regulator n=1 Tax=unclassified Sphingobacterium TaxID=2609468 RepID=UPI0025EB4016|nr:MULTISPECIES: FMN-binding negative transcriptional regulator [unclassified Sphingobacterium]
MFVPNSFKFDNLSDQVAFMKQYSFATMITAHDNLPLATQLPFFVDDTGDTLLLKSHFAAANEQTKYIEANTSLVIFSEPHAYISPSHYDKTESVPTWDYIAVHVYGKTRIVDDEYTKSAMLEQMIKFYEKDYLKQWENLPEKYRKGMMKGIVAFEMEVSAIQGQKKLSQNKTSAERNRIVQQLEKSEIAVEKDLARYIREIDT